MNGNVELKGQIRKKCNFSVRNSRGNMNHNFGH
jgi:hypothetical protein